VVPVRGLGQPDGAPSGMAAPESAREAMDMVAAGLTWLADADMACAPASVQADCLRALERAKSVHVAAHARVLGAFDAGNGHEDDGQRSSRTWMMWQTQVTSAAATGSMGWLRRLRAHPIIAKALRDGRVSVSWARQICDWTDQLPQDARDDADAILLGAAAAGAELADLGSLAGQMRRRLATPDDDGEADDGSDDRYLRLGTTLAGVGKLDGDLTSRCSEALKAVLDALGKKTGPEDIRTPRQRRHDALEEACRRLIASGCVPDRAGQPTKIQLHMSLDDLLRRMGADSQHASDGRQDRPVLPGPAAMPGDECDATITPIVTGRVDHDLLDKLTAQLTSRTPWSQRPAFEAADLQRDSRPELDRDKVRDLILANAVALLSGPGALASFLRTGTLPRPAASVSLPLDIGTATDTIPPYLRRAVILRDKHCAAPGCLQPPAACQVHHLTPRSKGGATKLTGLILLCSFHHLIAVHQWGWNIALNPDGTTTMTSPDKKRTYHSHSPPQATAA
jgi:hypothetical protein